MTAAFTHARMVGARRAACASTGNTSASLAVFCSATGLMRADHLHRLRQDLLRQARPGPRPRRPDRPDRRRLRRRHAARPAGVASSSASISSTASTPSGWKGKRRSCTASWRRCAGKSPDWIVVPGGNLGNVSAFGKAFIELLELGLIKRPPRLAVINAAGANTFYQLYEQHGLRWNGGTAGPRHDRRLLSERSTPSRSGPSTIASAIEINHPVNLPKALRALDRCGGVVREATDQEILDAKAKVGAGGLGCEPASAAQRRRRAQAPPGRDHRRRRTRRLHPDRPSAEGPDGDGGVSQRRSEDLRRSARQARRAAGRLRQPGRAGAQRSGRNHQGDRGVYLILTSRCSAHSFPGSTNDHSHMPRSEKRSNRNADIQFGFELPLARLFALADEWTDDPRGRSMKTNIGINGACGRMGQRIVQLAHEDKTLHIARRPRCRRAIRIGRGRRRRRRHRPPRRARHADAAARRCTLTSSSTSRMPEGTMAVLPTCVARQIPLVVATTGHSRSAEARHRGGRPSHRHPDGPEHEPGRQRAVQAGARGGRRAQRTRASTSKSSNGIIASRRTRPAAPPCTSPRSSRRRWAR